MRSTGGIPLRVLVPMLAAALLLGGCDAGEKDEPAPPPVETADPLPKLPREWKRHGNPRAGFAIGVPPHWSVRDRRRSSLLRSPDRLVAVSVSADRTEGGLAVPVDDFASRVADALPNLRRLEVDKPRPFRALRGGVRVRDRQVGQGGRSAAPAGGGGAARGLRHLHGRSRPQR